MVNRSGGGLIGSHTSEGGLGRAARTGRFVGILMDLYSFVGMDRAAPQPGDKSIRFAPASERWHAFAWLDSLFYA
jgi:hypothetical protein